MANNPLMEALMAAGLIKGGGNAGNPTGNPASTLPMPTFQQGNDGTITKTMPSGTPYAVTKDDARYGRVSQEAAAAQQQAGGMPGMAQQMQMNPGSGGYGHEVARPTGEQALAGLISSIQAYRKDNPMQQPFPAGTPTLQTRQFEEQQKQNVFENQLSAARESRISSGGGSGGSAPKKLNATQTKNDLLGAMTPFVKQNATSGKSYSDTVNMLWDNMDESDRQSLSLSDVQSQVKRVYELNGIDIKGGSDASGIGSALFGGFGDSSGGGGNSPLFSGGTNTDPRIKAAAQNFSSPFMKWNLNTKQ